jgi:hypothetical protein
MTNDKPARPMLARLLRTRTRRIVVPVAVVAVLGTAGVAGAMALSGGSGSFVVDAVTAPAVLPGGTVSQSVAGLWSGSQVSSWTKIAGPDWLSVTGEGSVTGTVPAGTTGEALVTVEADKDAGSTIQVAVPVVAASQPQHLEAASWNLDDAGASASWSAQQKELHAIVAEGVQVVGVQEAGGTAAQELASDLGWYSWQATAAQGGGDLGIISAYPIGDVTPPTATVPAAAVTIDVNGQHVRVWVTHLDESDYGPERACLDGATDLAAHEATTTRAAQAAAVAAAMGSDIAGASSTPVLMLGDLASPSAADWTTATSASHCNAGAVSWPAPAAFTGAGLTDSYRAAYADPAAHPGDTWSPLVTSTPDGRPEPQDRIDYVDYAGPLQVLGAESYATAPAEWPSDHAAAITLFALTAAHAPSATGAAVSPLVPPSGAPVGPSATAHPGSLRHARPRIAGAAKVGWVLRARPGAWSPRPSLSYQWYVGGRAIKHATTATFRPTRAQRGKRITVRITATRPGYATTTVTSAATKRVS